jgi:hypothetical protein
VITSKDHAATAIKDI